MNAWPLTSREKLTLRKKILPNVQMEKLVRKYAKNVEPTASSIFTHKCTCPSKGHKGGEERTASFYFSEENKSFKCFGCGIWGDAFDFVSLMRGIPADIAVERYVERNELDVDGLGGPSVPHFDISALNYELSVTLRDYLREKVGTDEYEKEREWVDRIFKRIDNRFAHLTNEDFEQARQFYMQIRMELERRKL